MFFYSKKTKKKKKLNIIIDPAVVNFGNSIMSDKQAQGKEQFINETNYTHIYHHGT